MRILVAGVGNIFLGDDGFGPEVVRYLARSPKPEGVRVVDYGIRGMHLAYDLLDGWDGETVRLLGQPAPDPTEPGTFSGHRFVGFSLLPWRLVRELPPTFGDLVRTVWRPAEAAGALEVAQAGIFSLKNVPEADLEPLLAVACPTILYPYARETVSDLVTRGGFPPVLLQPVSFEALYAQRGQQQPRVEVAG